MIDVHDKQSGVRIGSISEKQLQFLVDQLEEEHDKDQDYYLDAATIERLARNGADKGLLDMLRGAIGDREEMELQWSRSG